MNSDLALDLVVAYDDILPLYTLLRKECLEKQGNTTSLLRSLAEECYRKIKDISKLDTIPRRASALDTLRSSMHLIYHSLANRELDSRIELKSVNIETSRDLIDNSDQDESSFGTWPASTEMDDHLIRQTSRRSAVEDTIVRTCDLTFDDVLGLNEAKRSLREAIVLPVLYPQLFTGNRHPWRRILLYGPPGTGKSRLAMAAASQLKSTFYSVSSSDMLSCWFGESEKLIRDLFTHSRRLQDPAVIFMDEIDGLCRRRNSGEQEATRRIKTELLLQMDTGKDQRQNSGKPFIICATNSPWEIDPAFLRRFQKRIYIPLPDKQSRIGILKLHCNKTETSITDNEWSSLGDMTSGFSGSDLATVANSALFEPVRDLENATHFAQTPEEAYRHCSADERGAIKGTLKDIPSFLVAARKLEFGDFERSIIANKPTVTADDLEHFEKFTSKFGQSGA